MVDIREFKKEIVGKDVLTDIEEGSINKKYYDLPQSKDIVTTLFPNKVLRLSRNDIFNTPVLWDKLVKILVWGYRTDVRNTPTILSHIEELISLQEKYSHDGDGEAYLSGLLAINRLGLSTASKILYFMSVSIEGHPCIIVDARVESGLPLVKEFSEIKRGDDIPFYKAVISKVDEVAKTQGIPHDKIEYFLFNLGKAWDNYISGIRQKEAIAATKEKLEIIIEEAKNNEKEVGSPLSKDELTPVILRVVDNTFGIRYPKGWPTPTKVLLETSNGVFEARVATFISSKTIRSKEIGGFIRLHYPDNQTVPATLSFSDGILIISVNE